MTPPPASPASPEELFAHAGFLTRLARGLVGDEARAEDIVQDAFVAALERPPRGSLRGWLTVVVANLARNARRGAAHRTAREQRAARPEAETDGLARERLELQRALFEHVLELAEEKRTVLYLRYYEGRTPSEIAAELGVPLKTVKTRHTRAVAELRARLDQRSGGDRSRWMAALAPGLGRGAGLPWIVGGIAMKKLAAVAVVLVGAFFLWQRFGARLAGREGGQHEYIQMVAATAAEPAPVQALLPALPENTRTPDVSSARRAVATTGGLVVELAWSDGEPAAEINVLALCAGDPETRKLGFRAVSDAEGRARFDALFPGDVELQLDRGGRFAAEVVAGETRTVAYRIPDGYDVEGVVLDPAGAPVAGAEIFGGARHWPWPMASRMATSAADGRFRLRDIDMDTAFGARADGSQPSPLFEPENLPVDERGARTVALTLGERGGLVEGRVLDPDGNPLAGALVVAGPRGGHLVDLPSGLRGLAAEPVPIATAADGTFRLPGDLPPGEQPIHAVARGFPVRDEVVLVRAGERTSVELRLEAPASIVGLVRDAAGAPAPDVVVIEAVERAGGFYEHAFPPAQVRTDAEGRFHLDAVAPGARELNAHDGRRPRLGRAHALVQCESGRTTSCELALGLGRTITGRVVDAAGTPLPGWRVHDDPQAWIEDSGTMFSQADRQDETDGEGRFLLANVGEGAHTLKVSAPDSIPIPPRAELHGVAAGASDVVLVVEDAERTSGRLRGVFLGADGRAPADVFLVLYPVGGTSGLFVEFDPASGAFEDEALAGSYELAALRGGATVGRTAAFEVPEDGVVDVGEFWLSEPGRVELSVEVGIPGAGELPLERLNLRLDRPGASTEDLRLEGGHLVSGPLAPGTWFVSGDDELFLRGGVLEVAAGETTRATLTIELALRVTLRLGEASGRWIDLDVREPGGARLTWQRVRPLGDTLQLGLPPGRAVIEVAVEGGGHGHLELDVRPGLDPLDLELR